MSSTKSTSKKSRKVSKKSVTTKKITAKKSKFQFRMPSFSQVIAWIIWPFVTFYRYLRKKRQTAVHKSFVRTNVRDKRVTPKIEGYFIFPWKVAGVLWARKWLYIRLLILFVFMSFVVVGTTQVNNMEAINNTFNDFGDTGDIVTPVSRAFVTVLSAIGGEITGGLSESQYAYMSVLVIIILLTIVWLMRQQLAGKHVKVRDGIYSSASPIAAQYVLIFVGILQMIPAALAAIVYVGARNAQVFVSGIETAMFSLALGLVVLITLYFMVTTFFAMFIATIPGTYPLDAYRASRSIIAGQRARLLFRMLWMVVIVLLFMFISLVPVVIIVNSLSLGSTLVIPVAFQLAVGAGIIYGMAYMYLLYRRMIDDPVKER